MVNREFRAKMMDYLNNIVSYFPETIQGRVSTPSENNLFTEREYTHRKVLDKYWVTEFHHSVA